jgi:pantetheine-phosphate adenylyltransferase
MFPGSFDPFHNGHLEIVSTAARIFDQVVEPITHQRRGDTQ